MSYQDGWPHLYSMPATGGEPLLLTPGDYMAEYVSLSPDGTYLLFAGNTGATPGDLDRRHVVRVSVDRADAKVLTPGTGLEWTPVVTSLSLPAFLALALASLGCAQSHGSLSDGGARDNAGGGACTTASDCTLLPASCCGRFASV